MKDERIQTTADRIAARGFHMAYLWMWISLGYRLLVLKQSPRECWDIFAIWFICSLFGFFAYASKGVFAHVFNKKFFLAMCIGAFIGVCIAMFTLKFIAGEIHSVVDVSAMMIGFLPVMGLVFGIAYFLNWRWKRRAGIEEEK